jgi:hypothetical protein
MKPRPEHYAMAAAIILGIALLVVGWLACSLNLCGA